ncbi:hypothetical protein HYW83_06440 [Candidatus Peregrinibacteria bacterium]|nr:hypothetical protein [Candidatus Peregrinibacteria bacterium]
MVNNILSLDRQRNRSTPTEIPPEELTRIRRMQNTGFQRNLLQTPQSATDIGRNLGDLVRLSEVRFGPHLTVAKEVGLKVHEVLAGGNVFHDRKILGDPDQQKEFEDTARDLETQLFRPFMGHLQTFQNPIIKRIGESLYFDLLAAVQECLFAFDRNKDVKYFFQTFLRSMKKLSAALRIITKITQINGDMELPDALALLHQGNADFRKDIQRKAELFIKYFMRIAPQLAVIICSETNPQERMNAVASAVREVQRTFQRSGEFTYEKNVAIQRLEEELGRTLMDLPFVNDSGETTPEERMFIFLGDCLAEGLRRYRENENQSPARKQRCEDFMQILIMFSDAHAHITRLLEGKEKMNKRSLGKVIGYTSIVDLFGRLKAHEFFPPEVIDELLTAVAQTEVSVETYLYGGTPERLRSELQKLADAIAHFELIFSSLAQNGFLPQPPQKKPRPGEQPDLSPVFF